MSNSQSSPSTARRHDVHVVDLVELVRLTNSRNGNPRYRIVTRDHGAFTTAADAAVNYELPNFFGCHRINGRNGVTLRIDGRGNVWDVLAD